MRREIYNWLMLGWEWCFFRGTPERLPQSGWALGGVVVLYALASFAGEFLLHPLALSTLALAALVDTVFTLGYLGLFVGVRQRTRLVPSLFAILSISVVVNVPALALSMVPSVSPEWDALNQLLMIGLLVYSVLALARVLILSARFPRVFAVLVVVTYILADQMLVDRWLGTGP